MSEALLRVARRRYLRAWIDWYQVFNDDSASSRKTADTMKAYLAEKRRLREVAAQAREAVR